MRLNYTHTALCSLVLFALTISGCSPAASDTMSDSAAEQNETATAVTTVNEYCPIMGGKVTEAGGTVEWNGKTVGFCCDGCDEKWNALSDEEKAKKLAIAQKEAAAEGHDGAHAHGEHEHS